jgi:sugar/nucleoside kinase (ribokinase family)
MVRATVESINVAATTMSSYPEVLCGGIIVADHVCTPISHVPAAGELVMAERMLLTIGGCAANAAVDLAKMGVRTAVVGRVGDDVFGRSVAAMLKDHGVDVSCLKASPGSDTSQTLIVNVKDQDRRFIHTFGANADFTAADLPLDLLPRVKVLYLGGYLLMPNVRQEDLLPVFEKARQHRVKTVLDVAVPGPGEYLSRLEKLLPYVDVFLPNTDEAAIITGEKDPFDQAEFFAKRGVHTAVVTMGADGAVLVRDGMHMKVGVFSVPYVDGSGGGDAFDAGFIYGLLRGLDAEGCLQVASALGASCVRAIGTTPGVFTRDECEAFLSEHSLVVHRVPGLDELGPSTPAGMC